MELRDPWVQGEWFIHYTMGAPHFLGQIWYYNYYILSERLKTFDVFSEQKKKALTDSSSAILTLLDYLMTIVDDLEKESDLNKETLFKEFMKVVFTPW